MYVSVIDSKLVSAQMQKRLLKGQVRSSKVQYVQKGLARHGPVRAFQVLVCIAQMQKGTQGDPEGTSKDPDGPRWTQMDPDGPRRAQKDPEGPRRTMKAMAELNTCIAGLQTILNHLTFVHRHSPLAYVPQSPHVIRQCSFMKFSCVAPGRQCC